MVWVPQNLLFCSATTFLPRELSFLDVKSFPNVLIQVKLSTRCDDHSPGPFCPPFSISPLLTGLVTFHKEAHCPPIPALPVLLSPSTLWLDTSASPLSLSSPSSSTPGSQWYCMWTWSSHQCLWSSVALSVKGNWWDPVSYDLLVLSFIEAIVLYA